MGPTVIDGTTLALKHFTLDGVPKAVAPYGSGHINDTYRVLLSGSAPVLLQRINDKVFPSPPEIMSNIARVTNHLAGKQRALRLIPTLDDQSFIRTEDGYWRCYEFIDGARTYDKPSGPEQASEAARAVGRFQRDLSDLPGERLHEAIPHFHDTAHRVENLRDAIATAQAHRKDAAAEEIDGLLAYAGLPSEMRLVPERITHNDTKLNNVMIDDATGRAVCVLDLDTVGPGAAAYDFGDLARTIANLALEDERELSQVRLSLEMFHAIAGGYLAETGDWLSPAEREGLVLGAMAITLETGVRFLEDFLRGDVYFKVSPARPQQNLERCRTQLALLTQMSAERAELERLVARAH